MRKTLHHCLAAAALTFLTALAPKASARELVFTVSTPSGSVVPEISTITLNFPGFGYINANPETCEVTFGDRKLKPFADYELMLTDGGGVFGFAFHSPLTADTPTQLSILLPTGCVTGAGENYTDHISNDSPIRLSYIVAPGTADDLTLSLASVTEPDDKGELALTVDGVSRTYNRFYLKADAPGVTVTRGEQPEVTLTGLTISSESGTYNSVAKLQQAYGTDAESSYFYFDVDQAPTVPGEYTLSIPASAVADALHQSDPEFGHTNADIEILFRIVAEGSGVGEITTDSNQAPDAVYTLGGVRASGNDRSGTVTVSSDGKKIRL